MSNDDLNDMVKRHSAGATISHVSPFTHLLSHNNEFELPGDFITEWCIPFYMDIGNPYETGWKEKIKSIKVNISPGICLSLLGEFNWRPRLVGAYFAAVKGYEDLVDIIGVHLIKSELCCVGFTYALVLAFFNNQKSIHYLKVYLDYYLTTVLPFDQRHVLEALLFLDKKNNTTLVDEYRDKWNLFQEEKKRHEINQAQAMTHMLKETANFDNTEMIAKMKQQAKQELSTESISSNMAMLTDLYAF